MTALLRRLIVFLPAVSLLPIALVAASETASLARRLDALVKDDQFKRAHLGIRVITLPGGQGVYAHRAEKLFQPASNAKLFTAALILDRFGPEHRLQTSCYSVGAPDGAGRVTGDLIIYGRGDPSFSPAFHNGDFRAPVRDFARAIRKAGVTRVSGNLIADESYFNIPPFGSGWTWDDLLESYGAEVSALSLNDNTALIRVRPGTGLGRPCRVATVPTGIPAIIHNHATTGRNGARAALSLHRPFLLNEAQLTGQLPIAHPGRNLTFNLHRPALWFAQVMKAELEAAGVRLEGQAMALNWRERLFTPLPRERLHHVTSHASPPLRELVAHMMRQSQNLHAQLLFLQAGMLKPQPGRNTEESAVAELKRFLGQAGIPADTVELEEGSGLSRRALATPEAIVRLLRHMNRHPQSKAFRDSLPVAGRDGTLKSRFHGTSAENNLRAKTGSLRGIQALSGYLTNRAGQRLAFSILLNHYPRSSAAARTAIDRIAVALADSRFKLP